MRQIDLSFNQSRSRATRSADDFSRPHGKPFRVASGRQRGRAELRIPVSWNEKPVEFSLLPLQVAKVQGAKILQARPGIIPAK